MRSYYEYSYALEEGLAVLGGLFSGVPYTLLGIVSYVLAALALYTLARRRGIHKAWLAWIPVVNVWLLGSLSDQYRYVVKGEIKSKRKVLLILRIVLSALCVAVVVTAVVMLFRTIGSMMHFANERQLLEVVFGLLGTVFGLGLPLIGVSVAYAVIRFMALYDVYTSMDPENGVLFLVLSILFPVTEAFFLFFNRNKDRGMPPRRAEPVQEPWETDTKDYV